nr:DUF448 domain-containing protein [Desulfohalovibrio reitneri]
MACRGTNDKRDLERHVLAEDGTLTPDPEKRLPGRGYYSCRAESCRSRLAGMAGKLKKRKRG